MKSLFPFVNTGPRTPVAPTVVNAILCGAFALLWAAPQGVAAAATDDGILYCRSDGCSESHFLPLSEDFLEDVEIERMPLPYETRGEKAVLVMRVQFGAEDDEEDPDEPPDEETVAAAMLEVNEFLRANSFRQFSFKTIHITEVLTVPMGAEPTDVLEEARAAAREAGYVSDYEFDIVASAAIEGMPAGLGLLGGKGAWVIGDFHPGVVAHELGHNFGLFHSRYWEPVGPIGAYPLENGKTVESGNTFDIMSTAEAFPNNHFNANYKYLLRWLPEERMHRLPDTMSSGTYRLHRLDGGASLSPERTHAIRAVNDDHDGFPDAPLKDYWIEYRQLFTGNARASDGVLVSSGDEGSSTGNHLLNMNPNVLSGEANAEAASEAALRVGETFSDHVTGFHVTPLERGGTAPHEYIEVAITRGLLQVEITAPVAESSVVNPEGEIVVPLNEILTLKADAWATASPIEVVEFLVDGEPIGEAVPAGGGFELDFAFTGFDPGDYELQARVRNAAGNEVLSSRLPIEIAAPLPQVSLQVSREKIELGEEVELTADDPDGGEFFTMVKAEFFAEGESLGVRDEEPFVLSWRPDTVGDHLLGTRVTFDSGDTVDSELVTLLVVEVGAGPELPPLFSWFSRDGGTDADLFDIVYDGDRFVSVGESGIFLESVDGASWSSGATGASENLRGIEFHAGLYVAVGDRGTLLESGDREEWSVVDSETLRSLRDIVSGAGRFVAVGEDGRIRLRREDGTWRVRFAGEFLSLDGVSYGDGRFVAVGEEGSVLTSPDGMDWVRRSTPTSSWLRGVAHGGGRFVAVGEGPVVLTSPDGVTWTERAVETAETLRAIHFAGRLFVAVGDRGAIVTSEDGETWKHNASASGSALEGAAFAGRSFVAVGRGGAIVQSGQSGFANWLNVHYSGPAFTDPDIVGPSADPGKTGIPNLLRFAMGLDAHAPQPEDLPRARVVSDEPGGNEYLALEYNRLADTGDADLRVEVSSDLSEWEVLGEKQVVDVVPDGDIETVTVRDRVPMSAGDRRFMRVRAGILEQAAEPDSP